jgi:hypothetical protein
MHEFSPAPRPEDVLGQGFVTNWQERYDEMAERAAGVDLSEHLASEDITRLQDTLTELGVKDADEFLRIQVTIFQRPSDTFGGKRYVYWLR